MKLKTLKDLEIAGHDVVREEAIKWVKHWRSIDQHCAKCDVWNEKRQDDIMHFLNLTEEDLQ